MNQQRDNSPSFRLFFAVFMLGMIVGVIVNYQFNSPNTSNSEQKKTDAVLADVAQRDSLVLAAQEEAMYYREISDKMRLKLDSAHAGATIRLADIDTLVHTNFESLPDSTKLAYREKVLARLRANQ